MAIDIKAFDLNGAPTAATTPVQNIFQPAQQNLTQRQQIAENLRWLVWPRSKADYSEQVPAPWARTATAALDMALVAAGISERGAMPSFIYMATTLCGIVNLACRTTASPGPKLSIPAEQQFPAPSFSDNMRMAGTINRFRTLQVFGIGALMASTHFIAGPARLDFDTDINAAKFDSYACKAQGTVSEVKLADGRKASVRVTGAHVEMGATVVTPGGIDYYTVKPYQTGADLEVTAEKITAWSRKTVPGWRTTVAMTVKPPAPCPQF